MKREIRVRCYHPNAGFISGTMDSMLRNLALAAKEIEDGDVDKLSNVIVHLSTGCNDKNGKEVFEGDYVKLPKRKCGDHFHEEIIAEVKWDDDYTGLCIDNRGECEWEDMEVVGNVIENELE